MARHGEPTNINSKAIDDYATSIEETARTLRGISEAMKNAELPEITTKMFSTGRDGQEMLGKFAAAVLEAFGTQLANRSILAIQESKTKYDVASKTADRIVESAAKVAKKTTTKKKSS